MQSIQAGPLTVRITSDGQPVSSDDRFDAFPAWARDTRRIEKLVARYEIAVAGEPLIANAPFFYGSADKPAAADARDVWECMRDDLRSVAAFNASDALTAWSEWADDSGLFSDQPSAEQVRESIAAFQSIRAHADVICEAIGGDRYALLIADSDDPFFHQD